MRAIEGRVDFYSGKQAGVALEMRSIGRKEMLVPLRNLPPRSSDAERRYHFSRIACGSIGFTRRQMGRSSRFPARITSGRGAASFRAAGR